MSEWVGGWVGGWCEAGVCGVVCGGSRVCVCVVCAGTRVVSVGIRGVCLWCAQVCCVCGGVWCVCVCWVRVPRGAMCVCSMGVWGEPVGAGGQRDMAHRLLTV